MASHKERLQELDKTIIQCVQMLDELDDSVRDKIDIMFWFARLLECLSGIMNYLAQMKEPKCLNTWLLYFHQLLATLSFLVDTFTKEVEIREILTTVRRVAVSQVRWCLHGLQDTLTNDQDCENASGSFLKWMDLAFEKIREIDDRSDDPKNILICDEARAVVVEVLTHAMSIALVAIDEDNKKIKGSSMSVLEALDYLTGELQKEYPNGSMVGLFVNSCSDKLCILERRVNTTVLKLALKVFSEYRPSLDEIHKFCFDQKNLGKTESFNSLTDEFDLLVDRIMQIGLFAVSCSTDRKSCAKIKSCLASLESLEGELVPAFTAVLLGNNSTFNRQEALLMKDHWLKQSGTLKKLIFLIIDPFALCQLVHEEMKESVQEIAEILQDQLTCELKMEKIVKLVKTILNPSRILQEFFYEILAAEQEIDTSAIRDRFTKFEWCLDELESCQIVFESTPHGDTEAHDCEYAFRVFKRCKILQNTVKSLYECFIATDDEDQSECSHEETAVTDAFAGNKFFDHIMKKSRQILKDSRVLYCSVQNENADSIQAATIKKMSQLSITSSTRGARKAMPLAKLVHLRKLSFISASNAAKCQSGLDLEISDVLMELSTISKSVLLDETE